MFNIHEFFLHNEISDRAFSINSLSPGIYNQNKIYFVEDVKQGYILKIYGQETEYHNELNALTLFYGLNKKISVPKIYKTGKIMSGNYILREKIEGLTLDKYIEKANLKEIDEIASDMIFLFQEEVRNFSVPYTRYESESLIMSAMNRAINKISEQNLNFLSFTKKLVERCFLLAQQVTDPLQLSFITQDLRARHVIYNGNKFVGLIDFEYAKFNDISLEIGHFLHDLLMLDTSKSRTLFDVLLRRIKEIYTKEEVDRVFLYMIKQGIGSVASKLKRNLDMEQILFEANLIRKYIFLGNINEL